MLYWASVQSAKEWSSKVNKILSKDFDIQAAGRLLRVRQLQPEKKDNQQDHPALVFLHEGLGSIKQWGQFPQHLARSTQCDAIIYDRWGHGESEPLEGGRTARFMHQEALISLPEVLGKCNIKKAILIGHSDGGSIALIFAANYQETARGVITMAAHVFVDELTLTGIRETVKAYETSDLAEKLAGYHGNNTDLMFRSWQSVWLSDEFRGWNIEEYLPGIRCPVLAIQGENDRLSTIAQLERIVSGVTGPSKALRIPGCGHTPHREAPDFVLKEIMKFVLSIQNNIHTGL
jgi:pimeloyl-ACP methyl ester carboxylesterase